MSFIQVSDKKSENIAVADLPGAIQSRLQLLLNREMLHSVPMLSELDLPAIISLMQNFRSKFYLPGEVLFRQKAPATQLYFVKSGSVELVVPELNNHVLSVVSRGQMFGQVGIVRDQPHEITARATKYVEVLSLEGKTVKELMGTCLSFKDSLMSETFRYAFRSLLLCLGSSKHPMANLIHQLDLL